MFTSKSDELIRKLLFGKRMQLIEHKKNLYAELDGNVDAISAWQVSKFNEVWSAAVSQHEFYQWWLKENNLPSSISRLDELNDFPVLTKNILQEKRDKIFKPDRRYITISTGGSTGVPTKFITSSREKNLEYANTYLCRSWFGVQPLDKTVLFWGHSHLFGNGFKGRLNELKRKLFDRVINIYRLNAYDLSTESTESYFEKLNALDPDCLIGYTSSIYHVARYIVDNNLTYKAKRNLKCVIVTSESVTDNDISLIEKAFNAPVVVEYGMAETSVIAYTNGRSRSMKILWDSFIAQVDQDGQLMVTTLYGKEFPLINYCTNDVVDPVEIHNGMVFTIRNIKGRKRDNIILETSDGNPLIISGILIVHILKGIPGIYSISFKQSADRSVDVYVVFDGKLDLLGIQEKFFKDLKLEHPNLNIFKVRLHQAEKAMKTVAGKMMMNMG